MPHQYGVYGITLACDTPLPGLDAEKVAQGNAADIRISTGFIPGGIQHLIKRHATAYYLEPGYEKDDPVHLIVTRPTVFLPSGPTLVPVITPGRAPGSTTSVTV